MSGRYRIDRLIGEGGSAEVYEASVIGAGGFVRRVALKRLKSELARDPTLVAEFEAEARLVSRLHHANVVAMLDYGTMDGLPFQILEHVDGLDLLKLETQARTARLPLAPALWVAVLAEAAHGLDYVHRARDEAGRPLGLVHRDVTPSNVLVAWGGDVKLADFGIALSAEGRARTRVGVVKGKLEYLSPEQLRGEPADPRADVFALGCVLHRMLSGKGLLEDEPTRRRVLAGDAPVISGGIPTELARLIQQAVAPDAARRTPSAAAFAEACARWLAAQGVIDGRLVVRESMAALRPAREAAVPGALAALAAPPALGDDRWASAIRTTPPAGAVPLGPGLPVAIPTVVDRPSPAYVDITDPQDEDSEATKNSTDLGGTVPTSAIAPEATRVVRPLSDSSGAVPSADSGDVSRVDPSEASSVDAPLAQGRPPAEDSVSSADGQASDALGLEAPTSLSLEARLRARATIAYDVIEPLAEGGFAAVFRARHRDTGEVVALKVLRNDRRDHKVAPARFDREAAALARITSPYLVRLLDSGRLPDGRPWLAMELLSGRTLGDEIQSARGPLPYARVRRLARDIALGLAALHETAIVHRDLGARNVMVVETGGREKAMIIDLGHARWIDERPHTQLTRPGLVLGNARWMAPEQVHEPSKVGPAADLYSLGLLMLAMITGKAPFVGSPGAVLEQQLSSVPEVPPSPFSPLIRRLIEKDPARRLSSAASVAAELTQIVVPPAPAPMLPASAPVTPLGVAVMPPRPSPAAVPDLRPLDLHGLEPREVPPLVPTPRNDPDAITRAPPAFDDRTVPTPPPARPAPAPPPARVVLPTVAERPPPPSSPWVTVAVIAAVASVLWAILSVLRS